MSKKNRKIDNEIPDNLLLEISEVNKNGDLLAVPVELKGFHQKIYVQENKRIKPALEIGDKIIANMTIRKEIYWAKPVTRIFRAGVAAINVFGVVVSKEEQNILQLAEKNSNKEYVVSDMKNAEVGDYVSAELFGPSKNQKAKVIESFGKFDINKATKTMIIDKYDIPYEFNSSTLRDLENLPEINSKSREDYTSLPFVTIDGDDSKDFDDAIYVRKNGKHFDIMVAIADVSFYVRPNTNLDRDAYKRGNSVYLPNMVVPMLPELLSNDLCSLNPKKVRSVIVSEITIDENGEILKYFFKRGVIKSAARLTYKEVQKAIEGEYSSNIMPVFKTVIQPAYEAYHVLEKNKEKRGALNLSSTEIKIKIDKNGSVIGIEKFVELTSNRLIENFMILANVCAAKALKKSDIPAMYRIHDKPLQEKLEDVKPLLKDLGMKLPDSAAIMPQHFNNILSMAAKKGFSDGINDLVLRLQSQAQYSPVNIGHFGLALEDYAHFTSPIRRYSDLLVHRALVKLYKMPEGGELENEASIETFKDIAEHLCVTERRAISAERELNSRFLAAYLEPSVGQDFEVKITGFSMAGMFVQIESLGVEGLILMRTLPNDHYNISDSKVDMIGERTKRKFVLGNKIMARLIECSPITGGMIFLYIDKEDGVDYIKKEEGRFRRNNRGSKKTDFKKNKDIRSKKGKSKKTEGIAVKKKKASKKSNKKGV